MSNDGPGADETLQHTMNEVKSNGGNITAIPSSAAVSIIDSWISKLRDVDDSDGIVSNLERLKGELSNSSSIDGAKVSQLLSSLASETRELASDDESFTALANALDSGASKLSGK